mmetsp:Transcript_5664/g.8797  ORF Transcript_5664/g.8797 Transcript_5664/m.8797 type:complete len:310 (-) Transcript_5664:365-1294(-)|eukprot:CAMPEP_0203748118 /NCGR_PEP_ID=MMETSP0098-20131031/3076_1 /ASSEMBLY_ACC=CAM_ASM_000208 /TAXON_ID=96639 /ORGANISM=" , Strain NY0313808BC1" /LENGTH=309 /DNA_ID=CAMNT_0050636743 /DNA_START=252 /DNA_END=1181 /DNA_ORIENTATION=-
MNTLTADLGKLDLKTSGTDFPECDENKPKQSDEEEFKQGAVNTGEEEKEEEKLDHKDISLVWVNNNPTSGGPIKVYVGSEKFSRFRKGLDKFEIRSIVNCTIGAVNKFDGEDIFRYIRVKLSDDNSQNILRQLPAATKFIQQECQGTNVLIHCSKGVSRSCAVYLSWQLEYQKTQLKSSLLDLKEKRQVADPNLGFIKQLLKYERTVLGVPSLTMEDFLPCPSCLRITYNSAVYICGHRCCVMCLNNAADDTVCAHCTYADVVVENETGHESDTSCKKKLGKLKRSGSIEDFSQFTTSASFRTSADKLI